MIITFQVQLASITLLTFAQTNSAQSSAVNKSQHFMYAFLFQRIHVRINKEVKEKEILKYIK